MGNDKPGQLHQYAPRPKKTPGPGQLLGQFTIKTRYSGSPDLRTLTLDPDVAGHGNHVSRVLAERWASQHKNGSFGSALSHRMLLRRFFEMLEEAKVANWSDVTIEFLQQTEAIFSLGSYHPMPIWKVLRELPKGTLHPDAERFVKSSPNVPFKRSHPTEALPTKMLKDVLRTAMQEVREAERRIKRAKWDGVSSPPTRALIRRHEVIAFYILICMEWGMSPDVVGSVSFDPTESSSVQDWHEGEQIVTVRWYKRRAKTGGFDLLLADKPWRSGSLFRRLRDATAATRFLAPDKWKKYPWVCADDIDWRGRKNAAPRTRDRIIWNGNSAGLLIESVLAKGRRSGFMSWCQRERRPRWTVGVHEMYTEGDDKVRLSFRSIRPAAKWAKFISSGRGLLLQELVDDNTIEVLSAHYLNSEVAMRDIGDAWAQVPSIAEEVARGLRPTVLNRDGKVVSGMGIDDDEAARALGDNRVGVSGCRNPWESPLAGERSGRICGQANRSCFTCPNGVVSPDDISSLKTYLLLAEEAHIKLSPPEWALHWGLTVRWIMYVLPLMDPNWENLPIAEAGMFDLGLEAGPS